MKKDTPDVNHLSMLKLCITLVYDLFQFKATDYTTIICTYTQSSLNQWEQSSSCWPQGWKTHHYRDKVVQ